MRIPMGFEIIFPTLAKAKINKKKKINSKVM